ncbi:hypothetical protein U1T56_16340 [Geminicoccaceae bacterium SYSU G07066]|uniref:Uncharacterized protein n=2 Tax=Benzoatithermus flavus TaxID=3108223 RepID=A0ABU8XUU9_9PROT
MIVFRDHDEEADPGPLLTGLLARAGTLLQGRSGPARDDLVALLIDLGVLEAAIADALFPERDDRSPLADALRRASSCAGRMLHASWRGEPLAEWPRALVTALEQAAALPLPSPVRLKTPEGYAYYALYPEMYLAAAERLARRTGPARAVCIGLRGIGTSLAAVVAATLAAEGWTVESLTLRPRGHPFDRRPAATVRLAAWLPARKDGFFLVVDEGPGLSGSSLCGTAAWLSGLGIPDERIVLFPSRDPDPATLISDEARARWQRHRKEHVPFEAAILPRAPFPAGSRELSGGAWRSLVYATEAAWPATAPMFERRKFLAEGTYGRPVLHKFAGLGRYGRAAHARGQALAEAGFGPEILGYRQGFLAQRWIDGRPLAAGGADGAFLRWAARYFVHRARRFPTGEPARPEALLEMIRTNLAEGLGEPAGLAGLDRHLRGFGEVPAVAIDGRVRPHEWLATGHGYCKVDNTDHHADHLYPGPTDIAWDLAGFGAEFALAPAALADLARAVADRTGDPGLAARLPFYELAYLAARLGQASFDATALGETAEGERMRCLARCYRRQLRASLVRLRAQL